MSTERAAAGGRKKRRVEAQPAAAAPAPLPVAQAIEVDDEIAALFTSEALDHLGTIEASALALEKQPNDRQAIDDVFRPFHTIKASAGALGLVEIEELAHSIEDLLGRARAGEHVIGTLDIEIILQSVDLLTAMVRDFSARRAGAPATDFSLRRSTLRGLMNARGAIKSAHRADTQLPDIDTPLPDERLVAGDLPAEHEALSTIKVQARKLDNLIDLMGELVILQSMIRESSTGAGERDERLARSLSELRRISGDLHRAAISLRLVPVRQTFDRMRRLVRDTSLKAGKSVELEIVGEDIELDRKVVEEIADPLMHMLRNSIDHGIEDPGARRAAGKPEAGRIVLRALHEGGSVVISVADDGAGIDSARLFERAVSRGVVSRDAKLTDAETCALIFTPGLSTAAAVTEMSGRGVGMDVVRRNVEALRGRIEVRSQRGTGTTLTIKLPLTLATIEGLVVGVGDERFVLPTFSVRELLPCREEQLHAIPGQGRLVQVRNSLLPVVRLGELFGVSASAPAAGAAMVVIEDHDERVALLVDRLLGKQDVVIKPLGDAFQHVSGIAGGAILADGRIGLIVDGAGIIQLRTQDVPPRAA